MCAKLLPFLLYFGCFLVLANAWSKGVKWTRDAWDGPTIYSVLCSDHFNRECFEDGPFLRAQMGLATRQKFVLKKGAIPTIFRRDPRHAITNPLKPSGTGTEHVHLTKSKRGRKKVRSIAAIMNNFLFS